MERHTAHASSHSSHLHLLLHHLSSTEHSSEASYSVTTEASEPTSKVIIEEVIETSPSEATTEWVSSLLPLLAVRLLLLILLLLLLLLLLLSLFAVSVARTVPEVCERILSHSAKSIIIEEVSEGILTVEERGEDVICIPS